ncbi:MAG: hypothetical protein Kow0098_23240 [Ignavibacteriaceae bacterium]
MLRKVRQKIAASIAPIEVADDYAWQKWIKPPDTEKLFIGKIITHKLPDVIPDLNILSPELTDFRISFVQTKILAEFRQYYITARKTSRIFFKIVSRDLSEQKKFERLNPDKKSVINIPFNSVSVRTRELPLLNKSTVKSPVNFLLAIPPVKDLLPAFKPRIFKISLLNSDLVTFAENSIEESKFKFEVLNKQPKIFISHALKSFNNTPAVRSAGKFRFAKQKVTKVILRKIPGGDQTISLDVQEFTTLFPELSSTALFPEMDKFISELKNSSSEIIFPEEFQLGEETDITEAADKDKLSEKFADQIPEDESSSEDNLTVEDEMPEPEVSKPLADAIEKQPPSVVRGQIDENAVKTKQKEKSIEIQVSGLFDFQIKGARFLANSRRAVLTDQSGLGKTFQAVAAFLSLIKAGKIKKVLVITPMSEFYSSPPELKSELKGWKNIISHTDDKLNVICISGTPEQREKQWHSNAEIFISNYLTFPYDFEQGPSVKSLVKDFDCIVLDEFQNIELQAKQYHKLTNIKPEYLWCLSSLTDEKILERSAGILELTEYLKTRISRTKKEATRELPKILWENLWLYPDEKQLNKYNEILDIGRDQISLLVESGNPLRFQSNLFTLIHKLNQIANFSDGSEISPKSEALLEQLEKLIHSGEKVVIFSQYEKAGYKNIVRLLKNRGYKHFVYDSGYPAKELDNIVTKFNTTGEPAILIVGGKATRVKIENPDVNYAINFDKWWNPASFWNIPGIVRGNKAGEVPLHIYSYQMLDTLDQQIDIMLERRGLNDINMFSHFPAESLFRLIDIEDWLDAMKIKNLDYDERESLKKLNSFTFQELQNKTFRMFERFGYSNLEIETDTKSKIFRITGSVECTDSVYEINVIAFQGKDIQQDEAGHLYESMKKSDSSNSKLFIITTGTVSIGHILKIRNNLSFIDGIRLSSYFRMLNIS